MAYDGVKRCYEYKIILCIYLHILYAFRVIESGEEVVMRTRIPRYVNPMVCTKKYYHLSRKCLKVA